jgi:hypothetical protein
MTLWQRAPREVYRVYGQDEYLAEEAPSPTETSSPALPAKQSHGSRSARLIGLGVLVGVSVGALGLVVAHVSHQPPAAQRSVVAQSSRLGMAARRSVMRHASSASRASVHPPARANSAIGTYSAPVPRASTTPRPHARSLGRPAGRLPSKPRSSDAVTSRSAPGLTAVKLSRGALAASELSLPGAASPAVGGEFDFER